MNRAGSQPMSEVSRLANKSAAAFEAAVETTDPDERVDKLGEARQAAGDSALAGAYRFLQKLVGGIAVLLPFVVALGDLALGGDELQGSISAYYYTPMGNVFVGALCALGVFFLSYQHKPLPGYERDNIVSYGASAAAIGVALFPTAEDDADPFTSEWFVSTIHLACACLLFVLLAYFSLKLFTRTDTNGNISAAKRKRNAIHRACGWTIVATIVLVIVSNIINPPDAWNSLFWLESIGVVAFGLSWLLKSGIFGVLVDIAPLDLSAVTVEATAPPLVPAATAAEL